MPRWLKFLALLCLPALCSQTSYAQEATALPAFHASSQAVQQTFNFVADGPKGPGWTRPDEIARVYVHEALPTFFDRTLELDTAMGATGSLDWIFTGPHAGFAVTITANSVRLTERYYDSVGLSDAATYPSRTTLDIARMYKGAARSLRIIVDAHLSVRVLVNDEPLLSARLVFDVTRHQLMYRAPRTAHEVLSGRLLVPATSTATILVRPEQRRQTMLGFGGSPSIPAYRALSDEGKRTYWEILHRYNLLIDREYPMGSELKRDLSNVDHLADATPHYYGDNFPNGEVSDFEYSKRTLAMGGEVIYEMWALPPWASTAWKPAPGQPDVIDAWDKHVREAADPDVYARIVVGYCKLLKARAGSAPQVVGIQNEVEQPPEVFAKMTTTLRKALDDAGFQDTLIHMADAPYVWMAIGRVDDLKRDAAAWKATDFVTSHEYDFQRLLSNPDLYDERLRALHTASDGKPFLATEICLNDPNAQEPSFRLAFQVAQLYHKDLVELDAEALLYCWLLLDVEQPTFGGSRSLLVPDRTRGDLPVASSFELRTLGAFSRHIRKGMERVSVETGDPDILAAAYVGQKGAATLIVLNRSTEARTMRLTWPGAPHFATLERTSLYAENQPQPAASIDHMELQPGEIVTLTTEVAQ